MFLVDDRLCWSASDLTQAAVCEYATLRRLDYVLSRAEKPEFGADPLMDQIALMGDRHEERLLVGMQEQHEVVSFPRVSAPFTLDALEAAAAATLATLNGSARVLHQPVFFDGEFFGYADFLQRTDAGWLLSDAKLARSAKPTALLQLAAYTDQLQQLGVPLTSEVALMLGSGETVAFPSAELVPVFEERRARLRVILAEHRNGSAPISWGAEGISACGSCQECRLAAKQHDDLVLVAGLRMDQRRRLRSAGIMTVQDLAAAVDRPQGMNATTFEKLRAQAAMQWKQMSGGENAPVEYELVADAENTLGLLPEPSAGDIFFDFEGDPLFTDGDPRNSGLEYLWGLVDAGGVFTCWWAHDRSEERAAFEGFVDHVRALRAEHPGMHVYHYAPYETTALKRLAIRYQTREEELDELLRAGVFVDLYATVRGAIRVSAPSYSIKKLEPLYMGEELRNEDGVTAGDASVAAYHEFRDQRTSDPERAEKLLAGLAEYNAYDCLSTLRLRDWLLARADEIGVEPRISALGAAGDNATDDSAEMPAELTLRQQQRRDADEAAARVFSQLMGLVGESPRAERTPEQQGRALLAAALGYHSREGKQFWWDHYHRLAHPLDEWADSTRDVFRVESAQQTSDWEKASPRDRNLTRVVELIGDWAPGSKAGGSPEVVYAAPAPSRVAVAEGAPYGSAKAESVAVHEHDPRIIHVFEKVPAADVYSDLPVALVPSAPPRGDSIVDAIRTAAGHAVHHSFPHGPAYDLLLRRSPRLSGRSLLPDTGNTIEDLVAALLDLDASYLAVQGPPGTGKTYTGSRVIRRLVEEHGWRIGVVAQSHAVVENMLAGIVGAGLDPALVGKSANQTKEPTWTTVKNSGSERAAYLSEHEATGCVLGGTAWTFTAEALLEEGPLDLLVVDEAGQFSLANTIGVAEAAKRLLLLGDPQQLPQVSQGSHPEPVDESALGWLLGGRDTIDAKDGYFLAQSYRMHPALCERVSDLSYAGRLVAAEPAAQRDLSGVAPGLEVVRVAHADNRTASSEEAEEVVARVKSLLGASWTSGDNAARPLIPSDFLVVAPYNAQVATIEAHLRDADLAEVRVGTVDKFQGQEAPVAIVSMTASSHGDVPRGMGFLLSRNRLNVAISRAQWLAVVIRSEALSAYMPTSVPEVLELGAFIALEGRPADEA